MHIERCYFFSLHGLYAGVKTSKIMFEFQIVQTKSGGEITKIKVIDLDELYNFGVADFSI